MFRSILVPVDGSPFAEHAIPWALALAGPTGTVDLVHVHVGPAPLLVEGVVMTDPALDDTLRGQEADYLGGLTVRVRSVAPRADVRARNVDTDAPPADALAAAVRATGADLVVMSTHARGPVARFWLGSVADEFVRRSPAPVLFHRPADDAVVDLARVPELDRIVVPLDGSDLAEQILGPAAKVGGAFEAAFSLLLVLDQAGGLSADAAGAYLNRVSQNLSGRHTVTDVKVVEHGSPTGAVLDAAGGNPATGVALATHGRSGLNRLLVGSVADEVVRGAAGPVLVFHPPG